jgi:hypothetical protein
LYRIFIAQESFPFVGNQIALNKNTASSTKELIHLFNLVGARVFKNPNKYTGKPYQNLFESSSNKKHPKAFQ